MTKKAKVKKYKKRDNSGFDLLKLYTSIVKEIGITGFVIITLVFVFLKWATIEQKREFIDRFILFKTVNDGSPCLIVIIVLTLIILFGSIYCRNYFKILKNENNRIGQEKSKLQEHLLNKNLHTSD